MKTASTILAVTCVIPCMTIAFDVARAQIAEGNVAYLSSCARCHGPDAKGGGSLDVTPKAPDLTILAKRNGGVFPAGVVNEIIAGLVYLGAHGTLERPIWGDVMVQGRIVLIVDYLRGIQQK